MTDAALDSVHLDRPARAWANPSWLLRSLLLALVALGLGYWLAGRQTPGPASAEVGFARDMSEHHMQAVQLAKLLYDRSQDEGLRLLAYDIMLSQQGQIGMMGGWLDAWGYPRTQLGPKMEWMGMSVSGRMPGLASPEEIERLAAAQGVEAEVLFMQLMIPHHHAGAHMAEAAAERASLDYVRNLARHMAESQTAEIAYLQELLQDRGQPPVDVEAGLAEPHPAEHAAP
ncbi:MAG: DUF305 domain-containing protein [Candidatus Promineifilaceae bacterium]